MLAKRASTKRIAPGAYHLPGGHVEFGEDPEDALVREFQEEFHLKITIKKVVRAFSYLKDNLHTIGITYEVDCNNIPENIYIDPADTEALVWVDKDDFVKYTSLNSTSDHDEVTLRNYFN